MFLLGSALVGCTPPESTEPPPSLPTDTDEDSDLPWVDTGVFRPDNTGNVALGNDVPLHNIILEQSGLWELSGNPYDTLIGTLNAREIIDNRLPDTAAPTADTASGLLCDVTYSMQGTPAPGPTGCPNCAHVWDIQFSIDPDSETDLTNCEDDDLPRDGSSWRMGFTPGTNTIYFNFYGTGIYVPWWGAVATGNSVVFEWSRELAYDTGEDDN